MITVPLAKVSFLMGCVGVFWFLLAVALILIILVQKGRGGGLASAFGGGGGAGGLLGTKTGDFLTVVTISMVAAFLLLSIVMVKWFRPTGASDLASETKTVNIPSTAVPSASTTDDQAGAVKKAAEQVSETAGDAVETSTEQAADVVDQAQKAAEEAADAALEQAQKLKETATEE